MKLNKFGNHWIKPVELVSSLSYVLIIEQDEAFSPNILNPGPSQRILLVVYVEANTAVINGLILSVKRTIKAHGC